ncbi:MAG: hypothetical protein QM737_16250 [Ferruginibacter sp.]
MNALTSEIKSIKFLPIFILFLFCFTKLNGQQLTPQQFIEDLEFLKKELPAKHKNLFAKISEKKFNYKIEAIKQKSKNLNNESLEIELFKLIKEIGDEHTRIEPVYKTTFPVEFDSFEEGIFVVNTDQLHADLLYKKLSGIENNSMKELKRGFQKIIKTDNQSYFDINFLHFINNPRILSGMNISQPGPGVNFILDDVKYLVSAVEKEKFFPTSATKLLRNSKKDNYWYEQIDNGKILYFNYQRCSEQDGKSFEAFNNELWGFIDKEKPRKMIIDLRNNSGGNSAILIPFLNKLNDSYLNQRGSLYVLIGKSTFSSALMNAVNLKRDYQSILVGKSTSGTVNHYGETRGFRLPNSKIIVGYSTKYWEVWKGYDGALKPDVEIKYSIKNFRENNDEAIDYITNLE